MSEMIKYKVLDGNTMCSPFRNMKYTLGKEVVCSDFDPNPDNECSTGLYATDVEGLLYSYRPGNIVVECQVGGQTARHNQFKERHSRLKPVRVVEIEELKALCAAQDLGYNFYEAMFPIHPFKIAPTTIDVAKVAEWASVRASVGDSVRASVGVSVWDSVWASVRASVGANVRANVRANVGASVWNSVWVSVGDSVWDSVEDSVWANVRDSVWASVRDSVWVSVRDNVRAYISSLFPGVQQWKYIDHEPGVNPYQPAIDLWKAGLVPSYDGTVWRLHGHEDARVLWEGTAEEAARTKGEQ